MKSTMEKERLGAFMDAVIAIIMTILVLELERPEEITWKNLWEMRASFFAYAISFFWLGAMWVNNHFYYHKVKSVTQKSVWGAILMLFFSSLFPYATKLISADFGNYVVQVLYGIVVLLISYSNQYFFYSLYQSNKQELESIRERRAKWMRQDLAVKTLGLGLSATIFPTAMSWAVFITLLFLVIPRQLKQ